MHFWHRGYDYEAECYFDTFCDILTEASSLSSLPDKCEGKTSLMLSKIKVVMTDRCVSNTSFMLQLKSWGNEILPAVINNLNELPDEEKEISMDKSLVLYTT